MVDLYFLQPQRSESLMKQPQNEVTVLLADDDEDDCLLVKEAFAENRLRSDLRFVSDGAQLMDYLRRRNRFSDPEISPCPALILLDLNMPRMDGREVLREIKADPRLRRIPVVVLTTSQEQRDIVRSYDLGASSFITKPVTFHELVDIIRSLGQYWLETVQLPPTRDKC
jgi:CheY-like chemotaxis protein